MDWLWSAMWARIGWAIGEFLLVVSALVALVVALIMYAIGTDWKQKRCSHEKWFMTGPGRSEKRCRECDKRLVT